MDDIFSDVQMCSRGNVFRTHIFTLALGTSYDTALGTAGMCPCGVETQSVQRPGEAGGRAHCPRRPKVGRAWPEATNLWNGLLINTPTPPLRPLWSGDC